MNGAGRHAEDSADFTGLIALVVIEVDHGSVTRRQGIDRGQDRAALLLRRRLLRACAEAAGPLSPGAFQQTLQALAAVRRIHAFSCAGLSNSRGAVSSFTNTVWQISWASAVFSGRRSSGGESGRRTFPQGIPPGRFDPFCGSLLWEPWPCCSHL